MKIAIGQINPTVGDITGNTVKMSECIDRATSAGAELIVFSELSIVGYPPKDLLSKEHFVDDNVAAVEQLARKCTNIAALVGFVRPTPTDSGRALQNAAALLAGGKIQHVHVKSLLPTYDVFDETRYFQPAGPGECIEIAGVKVGLTICEDLWDAQALGRELYGSDPVAHLASQGAELIVNMAASPFQMGKSSLREDLFKRQARRSKSPIVYVNQVGGNDELIFDGASCLVGADGEIMGRAKSFAEDLLIIDTAAGPSRCEEMQGELARVSAGLKLGLRDYIQKCGFSSVVLGLSGGIDSAVVAALAADAIGGENVYALALPSRYSSDHSIDDARELAKATGIHLETISIEPMHAAFEKAMAEVFSRKGGELAAENIQARIRGNMVMAVSNSYGHLPLATGNKSELSCGYCTLYGDMCGGLAPIGDVPKTVVYKLAQQLNAQAGKQLIPASTITKPPSAELKPDQTDQDKLPPYDVLDEILRQYIECDATAAQIAADGFDQAVVNRIIRMVDATEYKRKQAPPVLKVTARAFGTGRRMPIAQRYIHKEGK